MSNIINSMRLIASAYMQITYFGGTYMQIYPPTVVAVHWLCNVSEVSLIMHTMNSDQMMEWVEESKSSRKSSPSPRNSFFSSPFPS